MIKRFAAHQQGVSLIELIVTLTILSILAVLVLPSAQLTAKRSKEIELKRNLRVIRTAIDEYKKTYDKAVDEKKLIPSTDKSGYPESLQQLVDGYDFGGLVNYKKKFLRRIPKDPFAPDADGDEAGWGLRAYADEADSSVYGGKDVYDVRSRSDETAIDGSKYKEW